MDQHEWEAHIGDYMVCSPFRPGPAHVGPLLSRSLNGHGTSFGLRDHATKQRERRR